jgi:hypothetical protein
VLQLVMLLDRVGLSAVRRCGAADCRRLFVKTYRREFCSERCQKRAHKRKVRQEERERAARVQARRQLRRTRNAVA